MSEKQSQILLNALIELKVMIQINPLDMIHLVKDERMILLDKHYMLDGQELLK
jgi:hypothetical protein